jgi:hypothetical protein
MGGEKTGPIQCDRVKRGVKRSMLAEADGHWKKPNNSHKRIRFIGRGST